MKILLVVLVIASSVSAGKDGYYLKYGTEHTYTGNHNYSPGVFPGNQGGSWTMRKMFSRCLGPKSEEESNNYCNEPKWIGFAGGNLQMAVAENPKALKTANFIKTTTLIQVGSVIALPVFLFAFINEANSDQKSRESGNLADVTPLAKIYLGCLGASFLNYVGWSIAEGFIAKKSIKEFNAEAKLAYTRNENILSEI